MGERVDATFTVDESVPVVAVPEGKQGHAQLNIRVDNAPSAVKVDDFIAADSATRSVSRLRDRCRAITRRTLPTRTPDRVIDVPAGDL